MNLANFNISLKEVSKLLSEIDFLRMSGIKSINNDGVSADFKTVSQQVDYLKIYKVATQNYDFDFLLFDESFFQFSITEVDDLINVRYAFYQNPLNYRSYDEFLDILRENGIIVDETDEEIGDAFHEDYEQFVLEQQINVASTSIRYDIDYGNYQPLIHSVSHIHIGNANHVRIPCDKMMTPLKFVLFVLKHVYYSNWKHFIESENVTINEALNRSKRQCQMLGDAHWQEIEKNDFFLT